MKAKYNATGNYLEEQSQMEEPVLPKMTYNSQAGFDAALLIVEKTFAEYNTHLASLRRIPCHPSCVGKWSDGQEVEEGKDYEVRWDYTAGTGRDEIAFPIKQAQPIIIGVGEETGQDDLWREVFRWIPRVFLHSEIEEATADLKKHFSIMKK